MEPRYLTRAGAALAAALLLSTHPAGQAPQPPAASQPRIVAIADIHGAADEFVSILQAAGLIDANQQWIGGTATLVQTGDYFDRGPGVRRALDLLMKLEQDARRAGGRVEVLLGNHEVMNLIREFRDLSPAALESFADQKSEDRRNKAYDEQAAIAKKSGAAAVDREEWMKTHPPGLLEYIDALAPKGQYGKWLRSRKVVVKQEGTIFMHAGLSPEYTGSLDEVNRSVQAVLQSWDRATEVMAREGIIRPFFTLRETLAAAAADLQRIATAMKAGQSVGDDVTKEYVQDLNDLTQIGSSPLLAGDGPLWYRGLAQDTTTDEQVSALLTRLDAQRFVIGHTPKLPGKIAAHFNGRVFPIDTGMLTSYFKGGQPSALDLQGGRITAIYTTGREVLVPAATDKQVPSPR